MHVIFLDSNCENIFVNFIVITHSNEALITILNVPLLQLKKCTSLRINGDWGFADNI